jgi:hypothetical protein
MTNNSTRARPRKQTIKPDAAPIAPFEPESDADMQEELDALDYEQPSFAVPGLDAILEGIEKEVDLLLAIYQLGE